MKTVELKFACELRRLLKKIEMIWRQWKMNANDLTVDPQNRINIRMREIMEFAKNRANLKPKHPKWMLSVIIWKETDITKNGIEKKIITAIVYSLNCPRWLKRLPLSRGWTDVFHARCNREINGIVYFERRNKKLHHFSLFVVPNENQFQFNLFFHMMPFI